MADRPAKKGTQKSAKRSNVIGKGSKGFTAEERAAMKERAQELKEAARREDGERAVLAKIAEMPAPCDHQSQRASPLAENLVRDARVCQGRQGRLLLPKRA
jgi:hypothetical protein